MPRHVGWAQGCTPALGPEALNYTLNLDLTPGMLVKQRLARRRQLRHQLQARAMVSSACEGVEGRRGQVSGFYEF